MLKYKRCSRCRENKPLKEYYFCKSGKRRGQAQNYCRKCVADVHHIWNKNHPKYVSYRNYVSGKQRPMNENRKCSSFLGVHIAEKVLSAIFRDAKRLPYGATGGDFVCGKGFLIDCKSSCIRGDQTWKFDIERNDKADYFLCLAFDDRESLTPLHVWLIPGNVVSHVRCLTISSSQKVQAKWRQYEKPLETILVCCSKLF